MPSSEGLKTCLIFIRSGVGLYNRGGPVGTLKEEPARRVPGPATHSSAPSLPSPSVSAI